MQCPNCGYGRMKHETRNLPLTYKRRTTAVEGLKGHFCLKCDEGILDSESYKQYAAASRAHIREINKAFVPELREIRKHLHLTQRQAAEFFGGGVNAFSRYEQGEIEPPKALVQLMRLLDKRPHLLADVRKAA